MQKIIYLILFLFSITQAQYTSKYQSEYVQFLGYGLSTAEGFIPTKGLAFLHNPGAQMITGATGNSSYPALTYGSNLVTNGDFHDFTFDDIDVEPTVKGHWIFSNSYDAAEGGSAYIGQDWSGGVPSFGSELVTNGDFVDATGWSTSAEVSITGGQLVFDGTQTGNVSGYRSIGAGIDYSIYKIVVEIASVTAGSWRVSYGGQNTGWETSGAGTYTYYIRGNYSTDVNLYVMGDLNFIGSYESVSVTLLTSNNPLTLNGWTDYADVESDLTNATVLANDRALTFNGSSEYFSLASASATDFAPAENNFTIEAWVNLTNPSGNYIINKSGSNSRYSLRIQNSYVLKLYLKDDDNNLIHFPGTLSSSMSPGWRHIAVVFDLGTNIVTSFVDGVKQTGTTLDISARTNSITPDGNFYIGTYAGTGAEFDGGISEVHYTESILTDAEILDSYNNGITENANTKGHWIFNSSTSEVDQSSAGNDLTASGFSAGYADELQHIGIPSYEDANALTYNGVDTYWSIPSASATDFDAGTGDFSGEAWIKTTSTSAQTIICKYGLSSPKWYFEVSNGNVKVVGITSTGTGNFQGTVSVNDGAWHHVAFVYDRNVGMYLYVDGVLDGSELTVEWTNQSADSYTNSYDLEVGGCTYLSRRFDGEIAEVRYTASALTATEIMQSYGLGKGWSYAGSDELFINNNWSQGIIRVGSSDLFSQTVTATSGALHEVTFDTWTSQNNSKYNSAIATTAFFDPGTTPASYQYYGIGTGSGAHQFYGGNALDYNYYDNIVVREVTNVNAVGSTLVTDYAGSNDGTAQNSMEANQPAHPYAWDYDGIGDYLDFGDVLDPGANDFILFSWFYVAPNTIYRRVIVKEKSYMLQVDNNERINFYTGTGSAFDPTVFDSNASSGWHFALGVKNGTVSELYIDGILVNTGTATANTVDNSNSLIMGKRSVTEYFDDRVGLTGMYIFDGVGGRPSSLPSNYKTAIIDKIYNNTSAFYTDD